MVALGEESQKRRRNLHETTGKLIRIPRQLLVSRVILECLWNTWSSLSCSRHFVNLNSIQKSGTSHFLLVTDRWESMECHVWTAQAIQASLRYVFIFVSYYGITFKWHRTHRGLIHQFFVTGNCLVPNRYPGDTQLGSWGELTFCLTRSKLPPVLVTIVYSYQIYLLLFNHTIIV